MTQEVEREGRMSYLDRWMREVLHDDELTREMMEHGASAAIHAGYMLMLHELLLRNMTNYSVNDLRGQEAVHVEWASWTGMTFHNLPAIALGRDDEPGRAFLVRECRGFVEYAATHPVPAAWHPFHPESGRGLGPRWQSLCEHAAHLAGMPTAYGVPAMSATYHVPTLPEVPRLDFAERFLPAKIRTFLKECRTAFNFMPTGSMPRSGWTRWEADERG